MSWRLWFLTLSPLLLVVVVVVVVVVVYCLVLNFLCQLTLDGHLQ